MRSALVVCAIAVAVGWPAGADVAHAALAVPGTLVASPRFVPEAGPVFAGDAGLAWITRRDERVLDLWAAEPGGAPRRVQRFSGADDERLLAARLAASPALVRLELFVTQSGPHARGRRLRSLTYVGPFGAPLRLVASAYLAPRRIPELARERTLMAHTDRTATQAVHVTRGCRSAEIRTSALSAGAALAQREPTCRLRLRRRATPDGERLRLGVSCAGFRIDCAARVVIHAAGRVIAQGTARYNRSTPPYAAANLRLTPAGQRLLDGRHRMHVLISARYATTARIRRTTQTISLARR